MAGRAKRLWESAKDQRSRDLGYKATFPLLMNVAGEPTYFIPLKDQANLVKSYAMVNVARYDIVATADTVTACEQEYIRLLTDRGVSDTEDLPQTEASGTIAGIRSAVLDGTTYFFLRLEGDEVCYSIAAAQNRDPVTLNLGDRVTIGHAASGEEQPSILDGYSLAIDGRAPAQAAPQEPAGLPEEPDAGAA